jgi:lipoprotein signal peptidase
MRFLEKINGMMKILKPSIRKIIFLAEWLVFIFILIFQGKIQNFHQLGVALYPLLFFYLIASFLFNLRDKKRQPLTTKNLLLIVVGLFLFDQLIKIIVVGLIPTNNSISVISGWFEFAHRQNPHGAWIFTNLSDNTIPGIVPVLKVFFIVLTILIIPIYQYLESSLGPKYWIQIGFVCIFSAFLSWMVDMFLRGYIVDFIGLPGLVTADLKDIYAYIGAAAIIIEAVEEPRNLQWTGLKTEILEIRQLYSGVTHFILQDLNLIFLAIKNFFIKIIV